MKQKISYTTMYRVTHLLAGAQKMKAAQKQTQNSTSFLQDFVDTVHYHCFISLLVYCRCTW